jgi:hypothetical protein
MASMDWSRHLPSMTLHCATQVFATGTEPMRLTKFKRLPALPCACQNLMFAFEVSFHSHGQPVKTMFVVVSGLRYGRAEASIVVALPNADTQSVKDAFMIMAGAFVAVRSRLAKVSDAGLAA